MKFRNAMLAVACAASLHVGIAGSQAAFVDAQGVEIFRSHAEGIVNCRGGVEPTGDFFQPCGPGVPGTIRDREVFAQVVVLPPHSAFSGFSTIIANVNFGHDGTGPMWGTFRLELTAGGVIEGTFSGKTNIGDLTMTLESVAHGKGGVAEGLHFRIDDVHGTPFYPVGDLQIRILNPGGRY
jgi:hypothetical protein